MTGQMHGIVYFDEQGHAVGLLYTWQDRRSDLPALTAAAGTGAVKSFDDAATRPAANAS